MVWFLEILASWNEIPESRAAQKPLSPPTRIPRGRSFASEESSVFRAAQKRLEWAPSGRYDVGFLSPDLQLSITASKELTMEASLKDQIQAGINFFNAGHYFEAHEVWEDMWRSARGPLRLFYQGLVQAAVGLHHLSRGNLNGATSQLRKSLSKLEEYPDRFCLIDNRKLTADLRRVLSRMTPEPVQIDRQHTT